MARIGNSVYRDICPGDPTCSKFGFYQGGYPTPMMEKSLLYKMCQSGITPHVRMNPELFSHAFTSKYGKVRIFKVRNVSKKSKNWVANPKNRVCDAPGSWYCTGQYPPAIMWLINKRRNFKQLEDFNTKQSKADKEYQEQYHRRMEGRGRGEFDDDGAAGDGADADIDLGLKYVGCYGGERNLPSPKEYVGGATGAQAVLALKAAHDKGKKYVAIARQDSQGHVFVFDAPPGKAGKMSDRGCKKPCEDGPRYKCGCADAMCGTIGAVAGEENVRRWVVYEVPKKRGKRGKTKSEKDEL
jgi:dolichyl-diphosphooligosaccharide--protein glycosyltransferase